ncbi:MAG: hypothetical protein QM715_08255 [Nibricoccus sp.]
MNLQIMQNLPSSRFIRSLIACIFVMALVSALLADTTVSVNGSGNIVITGTGLMIKDMASTPPFIGILDEGSISTSGNVAIEPDGADVYFGSASTIYLKPGFHAKEGCHFTAIVDPNLDVPERHNPVVLDPDYDKTVTYYPGDTVNIGTRVTDVDGDITVHALQVKEGGDWVTLANWSYSSSGDSQKTVPVQFPTGGVFLLRTTAKDSVSDWIYSNEVPISIGSHLPVPSAPSVPKSSVVDPGEVLQVSAHATDQDGDMISIGLQVKIPGGDWVFVAGTLSGNQSDATYTASIDFYLPGTYALRTAVKDSVSDWVYSAQTTVKVLSWINIPTTVTSATIGGTGTNKQIQIYFEINDNGVVPWSWGSPDLSGFYNLKYKAGNGYVLFWYNDKYGFHAEKTFINIAIYHRETRSWVVDRVDLLWEDGTGWYWMLDPTVPFGLYLDKITYTCLHKPSDGNHTEPPYPRVYNIAPQ